MNGAFMRLASKVLPGVSADKLLRLYFALRKHVFDDGGPLLLIIGDGSVQDQPAAPTTGETALAAAYFKHCGVA
jgi:hypothetical protein